MKQKFKGRILTTTKTVNNILRVYDSLSYPEKDWYLIANSFAKDLSVKYRNELDINCPTKAVNKVCGIIAALSPLKSWNENKLIAEIYLNTARAKHIKAFEQKCHDIMDSSGSIEEIVDILNGQKIVSFFLNIVNPKGVNEVTIDRHAVSIAVGEKLSNKDLVITKNQYLFFVNCYKIASYKRGILPLEMQSATWVEWRT